LDDPKTNLHTHEADENDEAARPDDSGGMTISGHGTLLGTGMDSASALGVENGSVVSIIVLGTITLMKGLVVIVW